MLYALFLSELFGNHEFVLLEIIYYLGTSRKQLPGCQV